MANEMRPHSSNTPPATPWGSSPCSRGVGWMVPEDAIKASGEQVAAFRHIDGPNALPLQALNGRLPVLAR